MLGGLFSGMRQTPQQQPAMYGNQFGMPQQGGMGMGYVPPYLMQYMQQFGMPMQRANMPMQQPNMDFGQQQAAEQYMRRFGAGAQMGRPTVPGSQGFPPPGQMGGPVAQPQPFYPMNQYQPQMGMAPNAAPSGAPIQNPMLSVTPEQLAQLRASQSGAPAQANMVQGRRATILPPAPPTPAASSPIRANTPAAPRGKAPTNARAGSIRDMDRRSLASVLSANRALFMR
jgi:hypothetical protein